MQCDICGKKKATVHLTEIVDQQMSEMHLCEECARQKSVQMEQQFGLADLLAGLADMGSNGTPAKDAAASAKTAALTCAKCALSYDDFRKFGRLGCGHCYISFKEQLDALLKKIHGSNHHLGKMIVKGKKISPSTRIKKDDLSTLRQDLQEAIHSEDFEKAATIRDKIREMEKKEK